MSSPEISIIEYRPSLKTSVLELLKLMWKNHDINKIKTRFEWRYENNPYQKSPFIYLALNNNKVVGFRSFVLQLYTLNNKTYKVFSPADTIVDPNFRRLGIISQLNSACIEEIYSLFSQEDIVLLNSSTASISMPVYIKQNWHKAKHGNLFSYKFSIANFLATKLLKKKSADIKNDLLFKKNGYEVEITNELKAKELSYFSNQYRDSNKFTNIRDEQFFNWRYSFEAEKYTYLYCRKDGKIQGYIIIQYLSNIDYKLFEYLATETSVLRLLINLAVKTLNISLLRTWELTLDNKKILKKSGFISEPVKVLSLLGKKRFPLLIRIARPEIEDKDFLIEGIDVRNIENWQLYMSEML